MRVDNQNAALFDLFSKRANGKSDKNKKNDWLGELLASRGVDAQAVKDKKKETTAAEQKGAAKDDEKPADDKAPAMYNPFTGLDDLAKQMFSQAGGLVNSLDSFFDSFMNGAKTFFDHMNELSKNFFEQNGSGMTAAMATMRISATGMYANNADGSMSMTSLSIRYEYAFQGINATGAEAGGKQMAGAFDMFQALGIDVRGMQSGKADPADLAKAANEALDTDNIAQTLVDRLTGKYNPEEGKDTEKSRKDYVDSLGKLLDRIEQRAKSRSGSSKKVEEEFGKIRKRIDELLMEFIKKAAVSEPDTDQDAETPDTGDSEEPVEASTPVTE